MNSGQKETISVHAGKRADSISVVNAIEPASAFHYFSEETQPYPRNFNTPNQQIVADQISQLEGAEASLILGSGMAAISTTLLSLLSRGDHIVLQESLYGGTHSLVTKEFDALGIEYTFTDCDERELLAAIQSNTKVVYAETPANPLLDIVDLRKVAVGARKKGVITIVDNTFASPICQNPIALGIDIVIHSGTKYLGGHSDLCFGAVASTNTILDRVRQKAVLLGGTVNALTCYLIERSIKTLCLRVRQQCENALAIAEYLESRDDISQVNYPGLKSHPGHSIAAEQMNGFGGMLSFCPPDASSPQAFMQALELIAPAMSLGGVESSVTVPALTSHKSLSTDERASLGISDQLVRVSVGIEAASDLIGDIAQALHRSRQPGPLAKSRVRVAG